MSATVGLASPITVGNAPVEQPYFARPPVLGAIFGAFPLVTLPMAFLLLYPTTPGAQWITTAYLWGFGISHFLITFAIYLSSRNLAYFRSTPLNGIIYFGIPAVIFLYFGFIWLADPVVHPIAALVMKVVSTIVSLATYLHLNRQSFGVLQLLKRQSGLAYSATSRRLELVYFLVLPTLQAQTTFFGNGRFRATPLALVTIAVVVALLIAIVGHAWRARQSKPEGARSFIVPLAYFFMQTASTCVSVGDMRAYMAGDAVHYTEYHAIMYPRVVRGELGTGRVDRILARLRSPAALFYLVLLVGSALAVFFKGDFLGVRTRVEQHGPWPFAVVINMINGIFLFHFFVDAFIWKFSNPFYRSSLASLYFKPKASSS